MAVIDKYELAARLDGATYGNEMSPEAKQLAKDSGLVVVYGASDDLMEFYGAIDDEVGAWEGTTVYLNEHGLLKSPDCDLDHEPERCPYYRAEMKKCKTIRAVWDAPYSNFMWIYETDIPHGEFRVFDGEDSTPYCMGIVFSIEDLK